MLQWSPLTDSDRLVSDVCKLLSILLDIIDMREGDEKPCRAYTPEQRGSVENCSDADAVPALHCKSFHLLPFCGATTYVCSEAGGTTVHLLSTFCQYVMARYQSIRVHHSVSPSAQAAHLEKRVLVNSWLLMSSYMQVDRDTVTGESRGISEHIKTGGLFKHSKTGNAIAADIRDASRAFSASEVWHAGVILYGAYNAADA